MVQKPLSVGFYFLGMASMESVLEDWPKAYAASSTKMWS